MDLNRNEILATWSGHQKEKIILKNKISFTKLLKINQTILKFLKDINCNIILFFYLIFFQGVIGLELSLDETSVWSLGREGTLLQSSLLRPGDKVRVYYILEIRLDFTPSWR